MLALYLTFSFLPLGVKTRMNQDPRNSFGPYPPLKFGEPLTVPVRLFSLRVQSHIMTMYDYAITSITSREKKTQQFKKQFLCFSTQRVQISTFRMYRNTYIICNIRMPLQ